jgi:hypothetical protein
VTLHKAAARRTQATYTIKTRCLRGPKVDVAQSTRTTTKEKDMPQIIVTADHGATFGEGSVTLRERVTVADFESEHFANQLVERLGWAVGDANEVERVSEPINA